MKSTCIGLLLTVRYSLLSQENKRINRLNDDFINSIEIIILKSC